MSEAEFPVALSAVALRLTDEVGQAVLDRVAAGDLAAAAELDQHVAAVRAELAVCRPEQLPIARLVGQSTARAGWPQPARPHHARRIRAAQGTAEPAGHAFAAAAAAFARAATARPATVTAACPNVPFADNPWQADAAPSLRLLLHYACGFVEDAVRADWWPANPAVGYQIEWQAMRLAAVCHLIWQAEAAAAMHPDMR